ncbi:Testis-expressed sequence 37 protein [Varanus komodoensis]|nr:Testis-expressed sequence 37 protein [Varanus komodoensis]
MYRTLYMMDYKPYAESQKELPTVDFSQKMKLEAQLKAKEFARPVENEPVKYVEEFACQEVQPPYPVRMNGRGLW